MKRSDAYELLKDSAVKFQADNCPQLGAALAFYSALSLSPLLLAVVALAGFVFGREAARGKLVDELGDVVGPEGVTVTQQLLANTSTGTGGVIATVIAIVVVVLGSSMIFSELRNALNKIWRLPGHHPKRGIIALIRGRTIAFTVVCGIALLLLASLVVSSVLSALSDRIPSEFPGMYLLAHLVNFIGTWLLLTVVFAMIFKWLPEADLAWSDVMLGAVTTSILFSIGKYLIGLYLGTAAIGSPYGAAGAFIVFLVWINFSIQILLFGAELTFIYARRHGKTIAPPNPAT